MFDYYPALEAIYHFQCQLHAPLMHKTCNAKRAKKLLPKLLTMIQQLKKSPFKQLKSLGNVIGQTKKWKDPEKAKFNKTIAAFAAVTGTPLKPITVQGAALKDFMTGDYKPDNAFDTIKHILYRKNKPD